MQNDLWISKDIYFSLFFEDGLDDTSTLRIWNVRTGFSFECKYARECNRRDQIAGVHLETLYDVTFIFELGKNLFCDDCY